MKFWKQIKLRKETVESEVYSNFSKKYFENCLSLGDDLTAWDSFLASQEIKFNPVRLVENTIIIEEEGYIEPTPDPMMTYMEDLATYNNIKATHELGLISDEEMEECSDYMKSLYPNDKSRMMKLEKPELFEKFRSHR